MTVALIQGSQLRSVLRRKIKIEGAFTAAPAALMFHEFDIVDADGKLRRRIEAGERVTLVSKATIKLIDVFGFVHVNPSLYRWGTISTPPTLSSTDGTTRIYVDFTAGKRVDAADVVYLAELRIVE